MKSLVGDRIKPFGTAMSSLRPPCPPNRRRTRLKFPFQLVDLVMLMHRGLDPFDHDGDIILPVTIGDFVKLYAKKTA